MKILIIVVYYLPSTQSSAKLIYDLATELRRQGHEPVVLAPDSDISGDIQVTNEEGVTVVRVRSGKIKNASKYVRTINEVRLSQVLWSRGKRYFRGNRCDLVICYSPSIFFGPLVKRLKELYQCGSYLIMRDIFPQWALDMGLLKPGMVFNYFKRKELENYDAADIIGIQSPGNFHYYRENGLDKKYRVEVLYNWVTLSERDVEFKNYRKQLSLDGKVVFFYGGNVGVAQDMDNIVRLAERLVDEPRAFFLIVGDGSEVERLRGLIAEKGLKNIVLLDAVDQFEYLAMLSEFDVGLITLDHKLKTHNFPGKMLGYMSNSMPTLASVNPDNDLTVLFDTIKAGFVCINGEDDKLTEYALLLVQDPELRKELGRNSRRLLETTFSVEQAASQILSHFPPGKGR